MYTLEMGNPRIYTSQYPPPPSHLLNSIFGDSYREMSFIVGWESMVDILGDKKLQNSIT